MCFNLVPSITFSGATVERLQSLELCRIRGEQRWVSESKLFEMPCTGDTAGWQRLTGPLLEPCISGAVDSLADVSGRVYYRYLKPFEELPVVDGIEPSPAAEDSYLAAFKMRTGSPAQTGSN